MMQEIVRADCGILFDFDAFAQWGIPITIGRDLYPATSLAANDASGNDNDTGGPVTEDDPSKAEVLDVVQPTHDQLKANPAWWILEIIPTSYTYQDLQDNWVTKWR